MPTPPLMKLSEAQAYTGLSRYKLLGLARSGHLRLKRIPAVSGRHGSYTYYLLREDLARLVDAPESTVDLEEKRQRKCEAAKRRLRIRAIVQNAEG